jgi:23S rRNA pseudouridine1911/1915/1917 synthase
MEMMGELGVNQMSDRQIRSLSIPDGLNGERIDAALSRLLGLSRNVIVGLIDAQEVMKDGKVVSKSFKVSTADQIEITMPQAKGELQLTATPIDGLDVVHDDEYVIVINKPVGIAAHPSPGWQGATVVGAIFAAGYQLATSGAAERQGVVHRLDVGTSGLMVVAKNEISYSNLKDQFRNRTVSKIYHALVQGHMDPTTGTIDAPIRSSSAGRLSICGCG